MRVKRGSVRKAKHKKIVKLAKGYRGRRNSVFKLAKQAVYKAGQYAYRDRRVKKRQRRSSWIMVINAALSSHDLSYSKFIKCLAEHKIILNRKVLADLAQNEPKVFSAIVLRVK